MDRRTTLASGLLAIPALASARPAAAATYGPAEGTETAPGVRQVDLGKREAMIPGYKSVAMRDIVYQPGASTRNPAMRNDMVCHCLEGELSLDQGHGMQFVAKKGDVWSCSEGMAENTRNVGATVAIMRITDLLRT